MGCEILRVVDFAHPLEVQNDPQDAEIPPTHAVEPSPNPPCKVSITSSD